MGQEPEFIKETEESNDLTFKKLGWLIKKSAVRIVILCVAVVLLIALVSCSVILATKNDNATVSALVDFNFKGIEDGKDPFGKTFDVSKIKSSYVVSNAIAMLSKDGIDIPAENQAKIIDNISVEGVIPDDIMQKILIIQSIAEKDVSQLTQLNNLSYFPSRYKLTISDLGECGLDKTTAPALLNAVIKSYVAYFKETYTEDNILATIAPSTTVNLASYDYIEVYDIFNSRIKTILDYLDNKSNTAPNFRSSKTQMSFNDLINALELLRDLDVRIFEDFIVNNGVTNNPESVMKNLEAQKVRYQNQIIAQTELIASLQSSIESYKNGGTYVPPTDGSSQGNIIYQPSAKYDELFTRLVNAQAQLATLQTEQKNLENRITKFDSATETDEATNNANKATAAKQALDISEKLDELIGKINLTVDDYLETEAFSDSITTAVPAVYQLNYTSQLKLILLITVVVVVVAAIAAVLWTYAVLVKRKEW